MSGSAENTDRALKVSIQSYSYGGSSFYSTNAMPELPIQFSNIQSISGLTDYGMTTNATAYPMERTLGVISAAQPSQAGSNFIYYSPFEMKEIYNASALDSAGYTGKGVTIAIVDAYGDPYIQQELNNFSATFGLPQTNISIICVDGPCNYSNGITQGWNTEIALDVEWAHSMAPGANINLYIGSNDTFPLYDAVEKAVSDGVNSIISMSWGSPENSIAASSSVAPLFGENYPWVDQVFQQAAAEGITLFSSTGDWGGYDQSGGETGLYGAAMFPSTDPYVTAVGGTTLYMNTTGGYIAYPYSNATGGYGSESAWSWNDVYEWGTGGGYSTIFPAPAWQKGEGFNSSAGGRGVPDVAWDADPETGVAVAIYNAAENNYTYYVVGGTSVGSPSWSGSLALIEQKLGGRLGLITPTLYSIFNNQTEYSNAFHDVTTGNDNPNSAGQGWSPVTGMGSPNIGELSNYLAPTGSLSVGVVNSLSGHLAASYSYGSTVSISANVTDSGAQVSTGSVIANITAPGGATVATDIPLQFSSTSGTWTGSYSIKSTDPPGEWQARVLASSGSLSGWGYTSFSVGGGITLFLPYFNATINTPILPYFDIGSNIKITASVTSPDGSCCVTSGSYTAYFYLNSPSGKSEGSTKLFYNSTSGLWQGNFTVPRSADTGPWAMVVKGEDSQGNFASTYGWMNIGMRILIGTDSGSYVLGDTMQILAEPEYLNGVETATGSFTATVTDGPSIVAVLPMSFSPLLGLWYTELPLLSSYPTGYYNIVISGNDGAGDSGTTNTLVRVALYSLQGSITLPSSTISVENGSEPIISAKLNYPGGQPLTEGSVEAFVSLDLGGIYLPLSYVRLNYDPATQSFVAPDLMPATSPLTTPLGTYVVSVQAFDPAGDYGNLTSSFFVQGISHSPISISSDSDFTSVNGVLKGSGTSGDPYIIAGWNTSSISISGVSSPYILENSWVSGSSGDGISINAASTTGTTMIEGVYSLSNAGNGFSINDTSAISLIGDVASGNRLNGFSFGNDSGSRSIEMEYASTSNNGLSGVYVENTSYSLLEYAAASNNGHYGFYLNNCYNATVAYDNATSNPTGIYVTGQTGQNYGSALIEYDYLISNKVGVSINGLDQRITDDQYNLSRAVVAFNYILDNGVGFSAVNGSDVYFLLNTVGLNTYGAQFENSLPVEIAYNVLSNDANTGLNITGAYTGPGTCQVSYTNGTVQNYESCLAFNYVSSNGYALTGKSGTSGGDGISEKNLNGSFVYDNLLVTNQGSGIAAKNVSNSLFEYALAGGNSGDGISASSGSSNTISLSVFENNTNGLSLSGVDNYGVSKNNVSDNSLDGILLSSGSSNNTVTDNNSTQNAVACAKASSCSIAGGIEISNSSANTITSNLLSNNTAHGKVGAGILLSSGSSQNLVIQNNATKNDAGIAISGSTDNTIARNSLLGNTYGVYYSGGSQGNQIANNVLSENQQDSYPNTPFVSFSGIANGTRITGDAKISWSSSGQAITNETLSIDGAPQSVNGDSFSWNSTPLSDGFHVLEITITNIAGQSASATLFVATSNHEFLTVETEGPNSIPISSTLVSLANSTSSMNATTDTGGRASFHNLDPGSYTASATINGTRISAALEYSGNSSIVLFVPTLVTTAIATASLGPNVPIQVSGNITASQLSNVGLQNSNGVYTLSFTIAAENGTTGVATLAIPKSAIGSSAPGFTPKVSIGGNTTSNQSFSQDANYYYVPIATVLNSSRNVSIEFTQSSIFDLRTVIIIVVIIVLIAAALVLAMRRGRRSNNSKYYLQ